MVKVSFCLWLSICFCTIYFLKIISFPLSYMDTFAKNQLVVFLLFSWFALNSNS